MLCTSQWILNQAEDISPAGFFAFSDPQFQDRFSEQKKESYE